MDNDVQLLWKQSKALVVHRVSVLSKVKLGSLITESGPTAREVIGSNFEFKVSKDQLFLGYEDLS